MDTPPSELTADFVCRRVRAIPSAVSIRVAAGDRLPSTGVARFALFVDEGVLALQMDRESGGTVVLEAFGKGHCITVPLTHASADGTSMSLVALIPCRVFQVPQDAMDRHCRTDAQLMHAFLHMSRERAILERDRLVSLLDRNPVRRTAFAVAYLAGAFRDKCPRRIGLRVQAPQETIAATANLSRQTANRALQVLSRAQILVLEPRLACVLDPQALLAVASGRAGPGPAGPPRACEILNPGCSASCLLRDTNASRRYGPFRGVPFPGHGTWPSGGSNAPGLARGKP